MHGFTPQIERSLGQQQVRSEADLSRTECLEWAQSHLEVEPRAVWATLESMRRGKAVGPSGVSTELIGQLCGYKLVRST